MKKITIYDDTFELLDKKSEELEIDICEIIDALMDFLDEVE